MKLIIKLTSLLLCLLILLSTVISCSPSEAHTTSDSTTDAAVEGTTESHDSNAPETTETNTTETPVISLPDLTIEELTEGFAEGEYTLNDSPVLSKEFLTALYRMTGEEEYEEHFTLDESLRPSPDAWYCDALLWAGNNSIIGFEFTYCSKRPTSGVFSGFCDDDSHYEAYLRCIDDPDAHPGFVSLMLGSDHEETEITRSDALVALYLFATKVLKIEVNSDGDLSAYADSEKFPADDAVVAASLYLNAHNMYEGTGVRYDLIEHYAVDIMTQIWLWALDTGMIRPYDDNTLRPDATLTRAEFAVILERFMDYVK